MGRFLQSLPCAVWLMLAAPSALHAQDTAADTDSSSAEVEQSDEAYRRRMELEDARQRDLGYTLPPETYAAKQEKLDKLPEESRDNIRDQLVDIIVANGDWEPSDALREYPYEPTAAAQASPELLQQEQEAWDEQIEKYNKREAAAYGTYLGPLPGPGSPSDAEGDGAEGEGQNGAGQGSGQPGSSTASRQGDQDVAQDPGQDGEQGSAGTYEPYQSNSSHSEEEISTAGVQQSALDFLKGRQGQGAPPTSAAPAPTTSASPASSGEAGPTENVTAQTDPQDTSDSAQQDSESSDTADAVEASDATAEIDLTTPGIIPIEDLDKLEGTEGSDSQQ